MTIAPVEPARSATRDVQHEAGREHRSQMPRRDQATFDPPADRDAVSIVLAQNDGRVPSLVPVRMQRMTESAFAFYRGAAAVMAADLAGTPTTGVRVQSCGDAHLANFGVFGSRDGNLIFDVNDFDETWPAPWEWDLKRLVSSIVIAGQHVNLSVSQQDSAALATAAAYRTAMANLAGRTAVQRFYLELSAKDILGATTDLGKKARKRTRKGLLKAASNTSERALTKLGVELGDGRWRIEDQPPLIQRVPGVDADVARELVKAYLGSVPPDVTNLLQQLEFQDAVLKVVGVGSVGTRCFLVLLTDADGGPLFLQIKEAGRSVLDHRRGAAGRSTGGERVVAGQRIMQASTDPFLGWFRAPRGLDAGTGSFYVRQFRDMKGSLDLERVDAKSLPAYGALCASALARAHAQSGLAATISGYLGAGHRSGRSVVDEAFAQFGQRYSEVNQRDFEALVDQVGTSDSA